MATLVGTPVLAMPPWEKFGEIEPVVTPRPICIGLELDPPTDWLTRSEKFTELDLKPIVLMFARLFPMTLSFCWLAFSPERLVENDITLVLPSASSPSSSWVSTSGPERPVAAPRRRRQSAPGSYWRSAAARAS